MVLERVCLSNDVYMATLQLALSTEKEEVICLLLGETLSEEDGNGTKEVAFIYAMKIPHRLDKKKDRVEISIEQLIAAQDYAEQLSHKFNKEVRVLGWFHSHPHITVWPSHVDVNTQANYQRMSSSFVGIICSVFSEDKTTKDCEVNLICFQSENLGDGSGRLTRKMIPFSVIQNPPFLNSNICSQTICDLPNILFKEEEDSYKEVSTQNYDILSSLHNDMLFTKSLLHITNKVSIPLLRTLETREKILQQQVRFRANFAGVLESKFGGCQNNVHNSKI